MDSKKPPEPGELLAQQFNRAQSLHRQGQLEQARARYQSILSTDPDHADALHLLGFLTYQSGDSQAALKLIRRSLALQPDNVAVINNLGNVLLDVGELDEAETCYRKVLEHQPHEASNYSNLCVVLRKQGRLAESIEAGQTSVRLDPASAMGWFTLGNAYRVAGKAHKAIESFQRSVNINPGFSLAHDALCQATHRVESSSPLGRRSWKKTIAAYQQWLSAVPNHPLPKFLLEALQTGGKITRAPDEVVRTQFDRQAADFEAHLGRLEYRVPSLVDQLLRRHLGDGGASLAVLDGGCGTGLCAPILKRYANTLVGVDLSPEMMRKANDLQLYDELVERELSAYVAAQKNRFDLAVYADTLCYFGDLREVIAATAGALRSGGTLVFSVEAQPSGRGFLLNPNGRFAHSKNHVEAVLAECGFTILECSEEALRLESRKEVQGLMVVARS